MELILITKVKNQSSLNCLFCASELNWNCIYQIYKDMFLLQIVQLQFIWMKQWKKIWKQVLLQAIKTKTGIWLQSTRFMVIVIMLVLYSCRIYFVFTETSILSRPYNLQYRESTGGDEDQLMDLLWTPHTSNYDPDQYILSQMQFNAILYWCL